jgi:hypothetical protein
MPSARTAVTFVVVFEVLMLVSFALEPDIFSHLAGRNRPAAEELADFNQTLSDGFSVRLYEDARPPNGKLAPLQKGAVLVHNGTETIGEGAGFGAPVLNYAGTTYYSLNATTNRFRDGVAKNFSMDAIEVGETYHKTFEPVAPVGSVLVRYRYLEDGLKIEVSLGGIPANSTLYILNEQAGTVYTRYKNSDSENLTVDFSWRQINASANYLLDRDGKGFRIDRQAVPDGSTLYLGREIRPEGFDWAGLDIALNMTSTKAAAYRYEVRITG